MKFSLLTPQGVAYSDDVKKITVPTEAGEITILEDHIPLISVLQAGELVVYKEDGEQAFAISHGMLEVRIENELVVLADTAERSADIDMERAEQAKKRAEELLAAQESELSVDYVRLQAKIEKELARLNVGNKYR